MPEEYPKEELQKIYEALPDDLKEAMFSDEVADNISDICAANGLEEEKCPEIAKSVADVFLGLLPPNEFEKELKEKLSLDNDSAKKISQEITRLVFFPLKTNLEALYKIKIDIPDNLPEELPKEEVLREEAPGEETSMEEKSGEEAPKKRGGKDSYREPIE